MAMPHLSEQLKKGRDEDIIILLLVLLLTACIIVVVLTQILCCRTTLQCQVTQAQTSLHYTTASMME